MNSEKEQISTWIFQAIPKYRIVDALNDPEIGIYIHWLVTRFKKKISNGHTGIIWVSGKEAGILAITEIVTDPAIMEEPKAEQKHYTDPSYKTGNECRVKMKIVKRLLDSSLSKEKIKDTPGLENLSIVKNPRGTNFPVTLAEWDIINNLLKNKN